MSIYEYNRIKVEEARQKACVHDLDRNCVAEKCMAWKWDPTEFRAQQEFKKSGKSIPSETGKCGMARP